MRVRLYKEEGGTLSALVESSPGKGRPPVLLQGLTRGEVKEKVGPLVAAMRLPKGVEPGDQGPE